MPELRDFVNYWSSANNSDTPLRTRTCADCGRTLPIHGVDNSVEGGGRHVCDNCYDEYFECDSCGNMHRNEDLHDACGSNVCDKCLEEEYGICTGCNELCEHDDLTRGTNGELYCDDCLSERYFTCNECGTMCRNMDESSRNGICDHCYNSYDDDDDDDDDDDEDEEGNTSLEIPIHPDVHEAWSTRKKITSFGIELETHNNFSPTKWFKKVYDGSVSGKEYVSAVLPYDKVGLKIVKDFCVYAKSKNGSIGTDCGYHLHLGGYRNSYINIKKVWLGYMRMERLFFSMMPNSRRTNSYCRRFTQDYTFDTILNKNNIARLVSYYYSTQLRAKKDTPKNRYNDKRYYFVNFHSWLSGQTIELRLHAGTLNYDKIQKWIEINKVFIDWLTDKKTTTKDVLKLDEKQFYDIVGDKLSEYIQQRISEFGVDKYRIVSVKSTTRQRTRS